MIDLSKLSERDFQLFVTLLGVVGGLVGAIAVLLITVVGSALRRSRQEANPIQVKVVRSKLAVQHWKHDQNDHWSAYASRNNLLGTVLNCSVILELSISNKLDRDVVVSGIEVVVAGIGTIEAFRKACERARRSNDVGFFSGPMMESDQVVLRSGPLDYVFWAMERYYDINVINKPASLDRRCVLKGKETMRVAFLAYRSFVAESKLPKGPEKAQIRLLADDRQFTVAASLTSAGYQEIREEFADVYGVKLPRKLDAPVQALVRVPTSSLAPRPIGPKPPSLPSPFMPSKEEQDDT